MRTGVEAKVCVYFHVNLGIFLKDEFSVTFDIDFREMEVTERELELREAARELGKARIAVALESAAAVARAEAASGVAGEIREAARD